MPLRTVSPGQWRLARLSTAAETPAEWIPASVPGNVQLDWAQAHDLPDLNFGDNVRFWEGLESFFWLYRTEVPEAGLRDGERLFLAGAGLDYQGEIRIDGGVVLEHTGFCTPFALDLSEVPAGAVLEILIHPAPKRPGSPPDRSEASHVTKPAVSYGWDWHPRLITLGLGDELRFEVRPAVHLQQVDFRYELSEDFSQARITVDVQASEDTGFTWTLNDPEGEMVLSADTPSATLPSPRLWWTHDHGEQARYELKVTLDGPGGDSLTRRVGFRRVRFVMHEGAWNHPVGFPKSRSHPPVSIELNGRVIFGRGSNWVNPDIFHGRITGETYRPLVQLARDAHMNILRCWGGAAVAKESFFELCDDLGILVWQEFPLACNAYPDDRAYLADLDRESRAIILRVRQHPCLALWCGGNELFNSWSKMDDQSLALRLLNRNCYDLDPLTPFLPTSPVDGMGHGDYRFRDSDGRDIFQIFQQSSNTAYSEFGCSGLSPADYLRTIIPEDELWPPRPGTSWETHHAFHAWSPDPTYWIALRTLEYYFGGARALEELVERGSWLQSEGYKSVFEEARRQAPRCSMALNWCFNEAWPSAANNSLINYPALPKPAYFAVQAACRPTLASARIPKFQWEAGEVFEAEVWMLNDSPEAKAGGEVVACLRAGEDVTELLRWKYPALSPLGNIAGPSVRCRLPLSGVREFVLELKVSGHPEWDSRYRLSLRSAVTEEGPVTALLNM